MDKARRFAVFLVLAALCGGMSLANAQSTAAQVVHWQLQVLRDGQPIDQFEYDTTVGQARTVTHHHEVTHNVGCKDQPGGSIDLSRTLTVSPVHADANAITLSIDAQEVLEDDAPRQTDTGCKLAPQPRRVSASHPGLVVPTGQSADWTLIDRDPKLVYRVSAHLEEQP